MERQKKNIREKKSSRRVHRQRAAMELRAIHTHISSFQSQAIYAIYLIRNVPHYYAILCCIRVHKEFGVAATVNHTRLFL